MSSSSVAAASSNSGGQKLRITGMASGLDVDGTVKKMISGEQAKVDKAQQDQQIIKWRQEAYQDIIKDVKDLQSAFFDSTSADKNILSSTNYSAFDVTGGTSSVATITAGVGAKAGTYKVSVSSGNLASKASVTGSNIVRDTSNGYSAGSWSGEGIGFSINGGTAVKITLTTDTTMSMADRVNDINNQINSNSNLKGKVQAVASGGNIQFQALSDSSVKIDSANTTVNGELDNLKDRVINPSTSTTLGDLGLSDTTDSFDITFNGTTKTISVKNTDKLSDVISNISTATGGSVTASFSQLTGKFTIESANSGSSQSILIAKGTGTGNTLNALGITDGTSKTGTDATVTVTPPGGSPTTVTKSTNNFAIDGVSYNLTGEGDSTVTVATTNTDKVYDKIKTFIDKYNAIVDKIQTKLTEKQSSTSAYKPLTDSQKESMTDSQITSWETKAKVGLLRNDENLQNMLSSLQSAFTTAVSGVGLTMGKYGSGSIGLDMSVDYSKPAHVDITDASKLKAAITSNGEQILKMFTNVSTYTDTDAEKQKSVKYSQNGIFARIKGIFEDNVGFTNTTLNSATLTKYANKQDDFSSTGSTGTNTLPNQIYQKQLLIDKLKQTLSDKSEAYYEKFSKLETAMNTLNSQQSYISQMMG
ncbi:flagellar filament capping protein FliD [Clostridium saccharobutylicum]|uniref:Flagellar hook-associated protein 2 n=2 Tax=Clostridium saccharobutylicum TaxID=169679 RepID=U5MWH2_CLOSA|nr:flagellar filament capping protein FliD [Clostridium saccharobutylicum]AGX44925.1 flagellar hook-associated protein 2 [Clostridium saccharobutylicum DSM 13864]AQR92207.1 flagellar capping protein [Clostridium saccharobutylicum]AQS02109.1 flagellar capping protein [Clostridium saccharobutylicum]AQS11713.1 flagellar capping protein [Clostridium saccharobutylicum]AQS16092.1 flagellar capping protein [Clostridium saccharobutylicum]